MARRSSDDGLPGPKRVREESLENLLSGLLDHEYSAGASAGGVLNPTDDAFLDVYLGDGDDDIDFSDVLGDIPAEASAAYSGATGPSMYQGVSVRSSNVMQFPFGKPHESSAEDAISREFQSGSHSLATENRSSAYSDSVPVHHALTAGILQDYSTLPSMSISGGHNLTIDQLEQIRRLALPTASGGSQASEYLQAEAHAAVSTGVAQAATESGYFSPAGLSSRPIVDRDMSLGDGMVIYSGTSNTITFTRGETNPFINVKRKQGGVEYNSEELAFISWVNAHAGGSSVSFTVIMAVMHVDEQDFRSIWFLISGSTRIFRIAPITKRSKYVVDICDSGRSMACFSRSLTVNGNLVTSVLEYSKRSSIKSNIYSYRCTVGGLYKTNTSTTVGSLLTLSGITPTGIVLCNFHNNLKYCMFMEYRIGHDNSVAASFYMTNYTRSQEYLVVGTDVRPLSVETAVSQEMVFLMSPRNATVEISSCARDDVFVQFLDTRKRLWCLGCFSVIFTRMDGTRANYKIGVFSSTEVRYEPVSNLLKYQSSNAELNLKSIALVYALLDADKSIYYIFESMAGLFTFIN